MQIEVGISNRHVHLTNEDLNILFGDNYNLTKRRDLKQIGQYACEETVSLKTDNNIIENVRIIGPTRPYTQVELSKTDSNFLGINPPVRNSGDLENSESITIIGPKGSIYKKNICIIANRHIHINSKENNKYNDNDIVNLKTKDSIIKNVYIKKNPNYVTELHLDKDDAILFNLQNNDIVLMEDD